MKKIIILVSVIGIVAVAAGIWFAVNKGNNGQSPSSPGNATTSKDAVSPAAALVAQAVYDCESGKTIRAAFYKGEQIAVEPGQPPVPTGSVKIVLSDGRSFDLPQTISADGGRYANGDESFVFWDKGDGAMVLEGGVEKDYKNCTAVPAAAGNESKVIPPNGGEL